MVLHKITSKKYQYRLLYNIMFKIKRFHEICRTIIPMGWYLVAVGADALLICKKLANIRSTAEYVKTGLMRKEVS
jgi:hypothetical protein